MGKGRWWWLRRSGEARKTVEKNWDIEDCVEFVSKEPEEGKRLLLMIEAVRRGEEESRKEWGCRIFGGAGERGVQKEIDDRGGWGLRTDKAKGGRLKRKGMRID